MLAGQLPVCDPDDPPAGRDRRAVAGPVRLEGLGRVVKAAAIELDDQASVSPQAVGLDHPAAELHPHVRFGAREAVAISEDEEEVLEVALRDPKADLPFVDDLAELRDPAAARVALDEGR